MQSTKRTVVIQKEKNNGKTFWTVKFLNGNRVVDIYEVDRVILDATLLPAEKFLNTFRKNFFRNLRTDVRD